MASDCRREFTNRWFEAAHCRKQRKRMFPMSISAVAAPVAINPPAISTPPQAPEKKPDVQNGAAADGTRTPQPTLVAALPPGQGTRIDQLA
jgi:hypothetical protein